MPVSKCGKCSFTTRGGIKAIGAHYRKKHPAAMKRRSKSIRERSSRGVSDEGKERNILNRILTVLQDIKERV